MKFEELVSQNLDKLNPTDLIVYRYINSHKKECCYISISQLGEECNVSRTTILRFAKKIGLDGFSDLKMLLKMEVDLRNEEISINVVEATMKICETIGREVSKQDFTKVNKLLYNAKRIFLYSTGHVQHNISSEICRIFLNTHRIFYELRGKAELSIVLDDVHEDDLFIFISLSGEGQDTINFASKLASMNIPLISITNFKSNTLAYHSRENLYVSAIEIPNKFNLDYRSLLGFFLLVEIWYLSYCQFCEEQIDDTILDE